MSQEGDRGGKELDGKGMKSEDEKLDEWYST